MKKIIIIRIYSILLKEDIIVIINGILGAIPAFIIRFIFQKRFTGGKAILISFLLTFLSTFVQTAMENHHPATFGSSITFGISMMLLLKKSDKSNKKAINPSSQKKKKILKITKLIA